MARFAFRFDPLYRVLGLTFAVTPGTSPVAVIGDYLVVRFGSLHLRTPGPDVVAVSAAALQLPSSFDAALQVGPLLLSCTRDEKGHSRR